MIALLALWGIGLLLVAVALVAALIPPTRSWHRLGVLLAAVLALAGLAGAAFATWSSTVVTEEDLRDAVEAVSLAEYQTPGRLSQQRLMALVSDELGHEVFADPAGSTSEEDAYDVRQAGEDGPVVCARVQHSAGTPTALPTSIVVVERGSCD